MSAIESFDLALMNWLRAVDAPWLDRMMTWISASGIAGLVWLTLAMAAFFRPRDRAAAWRVLLTIALAYPLVDGVLKPLIARPRPAFASSAPRLATAGEPADTVLATSPKRELPPLPRSYSFPSGHAASTFGAAVAVSRMWPQTRVIWWTLAILIGYSRIYLGHHYPLDVLGGALLGIAIAFWVLGGRHRGDEALTAILGVSYLGAG
jgi:undecaprenyl-diphosphatase